MILAKQFQMAFMTIEDDPVLIKSLIKHYKEKNVIAVSYSEIFIARFVDASSFFYSKKYQINAATNNTPKEVLSFLRTIKPEARQAVRASLLEIIKVDAENLPDEVEKKAIYDRLKEIS